MDDVTLGDLAGFCPEGLRLAFLGPPWARAIRGATTMRRDDDFLRLEVIATSKNILKHGLKLIFYDICSELF